MLLSFSGCMHAHAKCPPVPFWGSPAWQSRRVNERGKNASQKPFTAEVYVCQAPTPHNTCGSCWLGTAQQFYHDMRGEGGSRVTSKLKQGAHIHQPTASPLPHAGSGSHGQLFRPYWRSSAWHSHERGKPVYKSPCTAEASPLRWLPRVFTNNPSYLAYHG